jgi:hypothetical protein
MLRRNCNIKTQRPASPKQPTFWADIPIVEKVSYKDKNGIDYTYLTIQNIKT